MVIYPVAVCAQMTLLIKEGDSWLILARCWGNRSVDEAVDCLIW